MSFLLRYGHFHNGVCLDISILRHVIARLQAPSFSANHGPRRNLVEQNRLPEGLESRHVGRPNWPGPESQDRGKMASAWLGNHILEGCLS